jgi:hypothetical protein
MFVEPALLGVTSSFTSDLIAGLGTAAGAVVAEAGAGTGVRQPLPAVSVVGIKGGPT